MTVGCIKMTADQFLQLGEDPPGIRLELVNGEVMVSPRAIPDHSYIVHMLSFILVGHVRKRKMGRIYGDVDTIFGKYDVRRPDLIYFSKSRMHLVGPKAMEGPPDLCVEILNPSSIAIDRKEKFKQYEKAGVAHYWIVDPVKKSIAGFSLHDGKYRPSGEGNNDDVVNLPPFPELEIHLAEIWPSA